jgi:flagellar protein FlaG
MVLGTQQPRISHRPDGAIRAALISPALADKVSAGSPPGLSAIAGENSGAQGAAMEISALNRSLSAAAAPAETSPMDKATENREVVRAIKALNGAEMFGDENQLRFQRDAETQRMIIRIVNRRTGEVVSQIPPEYVLRLAEDLKPKHRG